MPPMKIYFLLMLCLLLAFSWAGIESALGREITDMAGRKVIVPNIIKTAYAPSPYGFAILYSVAPETLTGVMFPIRDADKPYLLPYVHDLPVLGRLSNTEAIVKANPDVLIVWGDKNGPLHRRSEEISRQAGYSLCLRVRWRSGRSGRLPGCLCLSRAGFSARKKKPPNWQTGAGRPWRKRRPRSRPSPRRTGRKVYYAEGKDGLSTEYDDSLHVHLLRLAGDVNVHCGHTSSHMGLEPVTIDQVKAYAPDVIIAQDKDFVAAVQNDPKWRDIKAVRNKRVHLIPTSSVQLVRPSPVIHAHSRPQMADAPSLSGNVQGGSGQGDPGLLWPFSRYQPFSRGSRADHRALSEAPFINFLFSKGNAGYANF